MGEWSCKFIPWGLYCTPLEVPLEKEVADLIGNMILPMKRIAFTIMLAGVFSLLRGQRKISTIDNEITPFRYRGLFWLFTQFDGFGNDARHLHLHVPKSDLITHGPAVSTSY